jgi:protein-S-isoprenylcysteine O-methyltransferase Ste14
MNEIVFRIAFGIIFMGAFVMVATYRRKAQGGQRFGTAEEGNAIAVPLRLAGLIIWLYPLFYIFAPRGWVNWSLVELPAFLRFIGVMGGLVAFPYINWAQTHMGRNVSTTVIIREGHQLVTTGPYKYVRHALYSGGILFFASLTLISGSWFLAGVSVLGYVALMWRLPLEEAKLIEEYGDVYRDYQARTGRIFPKIVG